MPDEVRTSVDFDRRFARPYQLDWSPIEAAIAACPKILIDVYTTGFIDGMTGRLRQPTRPAQGDAIV